LLLLINYAPKIRISKFAEVLTRGGIVCERGGDFIGEVAEKNGFAVDKELRFPLAIPVIPANATESGSGSVSLAAIGSVMLAQTTAEIVPLIVQPVMIHVIDLDVSIRDAKQESM
jgi:hypothetical protein